MEVKSLSRVRLMLSNIYILYIYVDDFPQKTLPGQIVCGFMRGIGKSWQQTQKQAEEMVKTALRDGDDYQLFCNVMENLDG